MYVNGGAIELYCCVEEQFKRDCSQGFDTRISGCYLPKKAKWIRTAM